MYAIRSYYGKLAATWYPAPGSARGAVLLVHPNEAEVGWLAQTNTGVCHCPSSNMILASGIAPIRDMVDQNVRVGLGVDGSASNDGNRNNFV